MTPTIKGLDLAIACAKAADETQAVDIRVLDLRGLSSLTDFMIICSGLSQPHLKAVLRDVSDTLLVDHDVSPTYTDGQSDSQWVVLDYVDVMLHVMHEESREFYALEDLWGDAKDVKWQTSAE